MTVTARSNPEDSPPDAGADIITVRNRSGNIISLTVGGTTEAQRARRATVLALVSRGELELWTTGGAS